MQSHVRLLNIVHGFLTEGADEDAVRDYDKQLAADPVLVKKYGAPSRGGDALRTQLGGLGFGQMGGKR